MFWRIFTLQIIFTITLIGMTASIIALCPGGCGILLDACSYIIIPILCAGVFAFGLSYLIAERLSSPLESIMDAAHHLTNGEYGYEIHPEGGNAVRRVAIALNTMSSRLATDFNHLKQDREQLRTILSGMVEGVVAFDNDQRVLFANDRASDFLGFSTESAVGRKLWEVTRQRAIAEMVTDVLAGGGPRRQEVDWNGLSVRSLAIYVSRLPGPNSAGAVMVIHDTTELRRLERLRQDFVANVSHELKTPLANIKSSVEVLIDGAAEEASLRGEFLMEISDQADRLHVLIQDLLTLARIESGETGLELEAVPVEEAVYACLDRHRTRAEAKGLTLSAVALGACPPQLAVSVDEEGFAQILDNLVDNAIKYTPNNGRITVRWQPIPPGFVTLEVEDTGIGIPERDLPRIFERFYRVDKARSREMGGTGLGLSIVKHLVQAMRGNIKVQSDYGKGTLFRLTLPRPETPS